MSKTSANQATEKRHSEQARQTRLRWIRYGIIGVLAAVVLVAFAIFRQSTIVSATDLERIAPGNIDGPVDAAVSIVEFGDFGCSSCRQWHNLGIKDRIQEEYGEQVHFVFRHFPVITMDSPKAAEAAQCAGDQGRFWAYHDYLYEDDRGLRTGQLKLYAEELGLDTAVFNACLDSGQYATYVQTDLDSARAEGATGTPTFFVNGRFITVPTYENLTALIEQELAQ